MTTDSLFKKYYTISIKFKIFNSQLIAKILLKQRSLNKIRHCLSEHIHFVDQIILNYFNDF